MVTSTVATRAGDLNTLDLSLNNVTLEMPSTVDVDEEEATGGEARRASPEGGSPSQSPVFSPKRVQFADPDGDSDPADNHDESKTDDGDMVPSPPVRHSMYFENDESSIERVDSLESEESPTENSQDDPDQEGSDRENSDTSNHSDKQQDRVHFADDVPDNEGKSKYKEDYIKAHGSLRPNNAHNINVPEKVTILHSHRTMGHLVNTTSPVNPRKEKRVGSRCKWACCCGLGWSGSGAVAMTTGVLLVIYLKQFWKTNQEFQGVDLSALLYYGIACCIVGGITLLVGLGFWTCACIIWEPYEDLPRGDPEKPTNNTDPALSGRKTKYVVNTETKNTSPRESSGSDSPEISRTIEPEPVSDDTFMI